MKKQILILLFPIFFGFDLLACTLDHICNDPNCPDKKKRQSSSGLEESGQGPTGSKKKRRPNSSEESQIPAIPASGNDLESTQEAFLDALKGGMKLGNEIATQSLAEHYIAHYGNRAKFSYEDSIGFLLSNCQDEDNPAALQALLQLAQVGQNAFLSEIIDSVKPLFKANKDPASSFKYASLLIESATKMSTADYPLDDRYNQGLNFFKQASDQGYQLAFPSLITALLNHPLIRQLKEQTEPKTSDPALKTTFESSREAWRSSARESIRPYISDLIKATLQDFPGAREYLQTCVELQVIPDVIGMISLDEMKQIEPWLRPLSDRPENFLHSINILIRFYQAISNSTKLWSLVLSPNVKPTGEAEETLLMFAKEEKHLALKKLYDYYITIPFHNHTERMKQVVINYSIENKTYNEYLFASLVSKLGAYRSLSGTKVEHFNNFNNAFITNAVIAAHFLSKPSTLEEGKSILLRELNIPGKEIFKHVAIRILAMINYPFSYDQLVGLKFGSTWPATPNTKLQFASLCPVNSLNLYCLQPAGPLKINLDRLGDPAPDLGEAPSIVVSEFRDKIAEIAKSILPAAQAEAKIAKTLINVNAFLAENRPDLKESAYKLKHIANYLMKPEIEDEIRNREIMMFVESFQVCTAGAATAIDDSFNRLFLKFANTQESEGKFNFKIDFIMRQIKYSIIDSKLLSHAKTDTEGDIQSQRTHMIIGIKKLIGKELGLGTKDQVFPLDPLPQNNLERAFQFYHVEDPKNWKTLLLKEFFLYYNPQYLIKEFARIANIAMSYEEICAAFQQASLEISEVDFNYVNSSQLPQLSEKGAEHLLLNYNYLVENKQ